MGSITVPLFPVIKQLQMALHVVFVIAVDSESRVF
jgi:hypothetical protein